MGLQADHVYVDTHEYDTASFSSNCCSGKLLLADLSHSHIERVSSPSSGVHMPRQVRPVRFIYLFRTSSNLDGLILKLGSR